MSATPRDHEHTQDRLGWHLATESIVVRIRWFGIVMGYALVWSRTGLHNPAGVQALLALGAIYAAFDTVFHRNGEVFLSRWPLFVSTMEAIFIALLCYFDTGLDSPFRWYYLLSALCCAIRYRPVIAWTTLLIHGASLTVLAALLSRTRQQDDLTGLPLTFLVLAWATWASSAMAGILKATGRRLELANEALARHGAELERRIAERTAALRASQARVIHQEKMAAFGLLSAGIAHEVGNPLAALSSLIQMVRRRNPEPFIDAKLELAERQLSRISRTIRELVDFSRPTSRERTRFPVQAVVEEALGIVKYYQRTKDRRIRSQIGEEIPPLWAIRDHLVQVLLNLIFNAIDATARDGEILIQARTDDMNLEITVSDDGRGIAYNNRDLLFQPHFTTKPQGTGLGLFVSRQMIQEMGGSLEFDSELGQGTTFRIRLPLARSEVVPGREPGAEPAVLR